MKREEGREELKNRDSRFIKKEKRKKKKQREEKGRRARFGEQLPQGLGRF